MLILQNDQILSGTLTFSDGTTITFGALDNSGAATVISVPSVSTTSLLMTVGSVSASTGSIGLAEFRVFGVLASSISASASATPTSMANSNIDLALYATASASSSGPVQPATAANDGVISGYPGDYTKEWASAGRTLSIHISNGESLSLISLRRGCWSLSYSELDISVSGQSSRCKEPANQFKVYSRIFLAVRSPQSER